MDNLILDFLEDKIEGETLETIFEAITRFFNLGRVKIEEHLDHMVDEGKLQFFHIGASPRYAINPPE